MNGICGELISYRTILYYNFNSDQFFCMIKKIISAVKIQIFYELFHPEVIGSLRPQPCP